ncbi:hypothetical protein [Eubacterium limosum]|uniref:hypothetical protein n=1 Tax=Eubacterium limosum TaxID=1736 RepID=UPI000D7196E0
MAAAIPKGSPLICFDEHTSGLDYDSMVRVSRLIQRRSGMGAIIFVVSHDFEFIVRSYSSVLQLERNGKARQKPLGCKLFEQPSHQYFY